MLRLLAALLLVVLVAGPARAQRLWPVAGTVTEGYGSYRHPVTGAAAPNPGVFIGTVPGVHVQAVEAGVVAKVDMLPEYGTYVLLRHGETLTAYGNLSLVGVRVGDSIRAGQVVGRAGTAHQPKGAGLFFAVFRYDASSRAARPLDPLGWLRGE
jgi:murein hydrolase activator